MKEANHKLDSYFRIDGDEFLRKRVKNKATEESYENKKFVICDEVQKLIQRIKQEREYVNADLKIGIDGGREFLKICLSVMKSTNDSKVCDLEKKTDCTIAMALRQINSKIRE